MSNYKEKTTQILIEFGDSTSHSSILKQLINQLVKYKFASRKEIEEEFVTILQAKAYRSTTD